MILPGSPKLAALGLDLDASLDEPPRFLIDAQLLTSLHVELAQVLSADELRFVLLQLGFVHGLRDAALEVHHLGGSRSDLAAPTAGVSAPPLAMSLDGSPETEDGRLHVRGTWPAGAEAEAVARGVGPAEAPACWVSAGYTSGWLSGLFGANLLAIEHECAAAGGSSCRFEAREAGHTGAWPAWAEAFPFDALRDTTRRHLERRPRDPEPEGFDGTSSAIHVWGPVMVIPYSGAEDALRAVELIERDPEARQVRVVLLDLSGTIIDEGFGAAEIERILEAIVAVGAEPVLAGVSPLSAHVAEDLERSHLVLHKDLPDAIAVAFQLAEVQRSGV